MGRRMRGGVEEGRERAKVAVEGAAACASLSGTNECGCSLSERARACACVGCEDEEAAAVSDGAAAAASGSGISMIEDPSLFHLLSARVSEHAAHHRNLSSSTSLPPSLTFCKKRKSVLRLRATGLAANIQGAGGCGLK